MTAPRSPDDPPASVASLGPVAPYRGWLFLGDEETEYLGSVEAPTRVRSQQETTALRRLNPGWNEDHTTMTLVLVRDPERSEYVSECLAAGRMP